MNLKLLKFFFFITLCFTQKNYIIENPSFNEMLSSLKINTMLQDKNGFLWIGTENGLYRYNGQSVKEIYQLGNDKIRSKYIISLFQSSDSKIWVGTDEGLSIIDKTNKKLDHFYRSGNDSTAILNNFIHEIKEDHENKMIIATDAGISIIDREKKITNHGKNSNLTHTHTMTVVVDNKNRYWTGTTKFVNTFENHKWSSIYLKEYTGNKNTTHFHTNRIRKIKVTKNNWLWTCTDRGMSIYDLNTDQQIMKDFSSKYKLNQIVINDIIDIDNEQYLIASNNGLRLLDLKQKKLESINTKDGLNGNQIFSLIKDKSGFAWLGTNNGVNKFYYNSHDISVFHPNTVLDEDESNEIFSVKEDKSGNIVIATLSKILVMNNDLNKKIQELRTARVKNLAIGNNGDLYISSYANGFMVYDSNYKFKLLLPDYINRKVHISSSYIECGKFIPGINKYVIGTLASGVNLVNPTSLRPTVLHTNHENPDLRIVHNTVYDFYYKYDILWIASHNGLDRFDLTKQKVKNFLKDYEIHRIIKLRNHLWLASKNHGLLKFNLSNYKVEERFDRTKGLADNSVKDILPDSNQLWILSAKGLNKLDIPSQKVSRISAIDKYLSFRQKEYTSMTQKKDGTLLIGSQSGLIVYKGNENNYSPVKPKAVITDIKYLNESLINSKYEIETNNFEFPANFNSLNFEFSCLDFYDPKSNHFFYRLDGVDKNWINSGSRNYISYPKLAPGTYRLLLKASNSFGITSDESFVQFRILEPFYKRTWFFILILIVLFVTAYIIFQFKNERKKEIQKIRRKIAGDLHDQIGSTLTEITLLSEMAQVNSSGLGFKLKKIEDKSRRSIAEMSDLVWSIDSAKDNWDDLLSRLKDFALNLLSYHDVNCRFSQKGEFPKSKLDPSFRQNIYLMFKEIIHNIVKHSSADDVKIDLFYSKKFIMLIKDNGKGFNINSVEKGNGLRNLESRARNIKAHLSIENDNGTVIRIEEK